MSLYDNCYCAYVYSLHTVASLMACVFTCAVTVYCCNVCAYTTLVQQIYFKLYTQWTSPTSLILELRQVILNMRKEASTYGFSFNRFFFSEDLKTLFL